MLQFVYKARDEFGKAVKGSLEAEDEENLASNLSQMGYYLISAKETKSNKTNPNKENPNGATINSFRHTAFQWGGFKREDLITFTGHLSTMLSAGIPILEGLEDFAAHVERPAFKKVVEKMHKDIHGGLNLSDALYRYPKVFSELYVNVVKAGEATGNVPQVLSNLTRFLEWQQTIASNIKRATIYPATVLSVVGLLQ
jgi:type II secretory pathway component PulF